MSNKKKRYKQEAKEVTEQVEEFKCYIDGDKRLINYRERTYENRFTVKAIMACEKLLGGSLVSSFVKTDAMLSIADLKVIFSNTLFQLDGGKVSDKQAEDIFEAVLLNDGYVALVQYVTVKIMEDCPFLFRNNS